MSLPQYLMRDFPPAASAAARLQTCGSLLVMLQNLIRNAAERGGEDAVCLSTHGAHGLVLLLGAVEQEVMLHAKE